MRTNFVVNNLPPLSEEEDERIERSYRNNPVVERILNLYRAIRSTSTGKVSWYKYGQSVTVYSDLISLKRAGFVDLSFDFVSNTLTWVPLTVPANTTKIHRSFKESKELWYVNAPNGDGPHEFTMGQARQLYHAFKDEPALLQIYLLLNSCRGPQKQEVNMKALAGELGITKHRLILFMNILETSGFIRRGPIIAEILVLTPPEHCPMESNTVSDNVIRVWLTGPEKAADAIQEVVGANGRRTHSSTDTLLAFATDIEQANGRKVYIDGRKWRFPASRLVKQETLWDLARAWYTFSRGSGEYGADKYGYTLYTFEQHIAEIREQSSSESSFVKFLQDNGLLEKWADLLAPADKKLDLYKRIDTLYREEFLKAFRVRALAGEFDKEFDTLKIARLKRDQMYIYWMHEAIQCLGKDNIPEYFLPDGLVEEYKKLLLREENKKSKAG